MREPSPRPPGSSAGPRDFRTDAARRMVLASITTPAWTSLFAMASGVVTDIGGPLSHSSIRGPRVRHSRCARHGRRDPAHSSGQLITVDGDAGVVTLLDGHEPQEVEQINEELFAPQDHRFGAAGGGAPRRAGRMGSPGEADRGRARGGLSPTHCDQPLNAGTESRGRPSTAQGVATPHAQG